MEAQLRHAIIERPTELFVGTASLFALAALSSSPSAVPLVVVVAALQLFLRVVLTRERVFIRLLSAWLGLSASISIGHLWASLQALSTPSLSLLLLFTLSSLSSAIALTAIALDIKIFDRVRSPWAQLTVFPLIWTSTWAAVSYTNPLGRLVVWSPVFGFEGYDWMIPFMGPLAKDWMVAAWAVVISQMIGNWFIGDVDKASSGNSAFDVGLIDHPPNGECSSPSRPCQTFVLGAILTALLIPSFIINDIPSSISSPHITPFTVGCVLPVSTDHNLLPSLDDFIEESKKMTSAHLLLWPEGAVTFGSAAEREAALDKVRQLVRGPYVGVAFEEFVPRENGSRGRRNIKQTGIALVSHISGETLLSYYKRSLVPIAESFSLAPSPNPPPLYTINLGPPRGTKKTGWAPAPNYTRPISATVSICLDFAQPAPFRELDARPSLILAPARTWHTSVGLAMWEQAKARARELDSKVLWCDGGEGGLSGVIGRGMNDVTQSGSGSWMRKIGIEWPFDERRTIYAKAGDMAVLMVFVGILGLGWVVEAAQGTLVGPSFTSVTVYLRRARRGMKNWRVLNRASGQGESTPLLT